MPIPNLITDLSTTAASNYPQGSDSPSTLDDVQRAHGSFIAQLRTGAVATTANITAGTIDGATVGATTASTGKFTTLQATSGLNSTAVGNTTPSTGAFTTLSTTGAATLASASVTGALTGVATANFNSGAVVFDGANIGLGVTPVSLGASIPTIDVAGTNGGGMRFRTSGAGNSGYLLANTSGIDLFSGDSVYIRFGTAATERARIDSSGNLLVGTTSYNAGSDVHTRCHFYTADGAGNVANFENAHGSTPLGIALRYTASPNSTTAQFLIAADGTTTRAEIRSNGGLANFSANNVNLSDRRTKKNIQDAGNYLDKICAIPVRTFLYNDQTDDQLNLGAIAQEVEAVAPELVDTSGFGETPEDGVPLKAIYQTDLQYALMKSIQELKAIVDSQAARIAALEAK